jgi:hypothetical protein
MHVPRTLIVEHPIGRPLGAAGDVERQHAVLEAAFDLAATATENGTIWELSSAYRPTPTSG